MIVKSNKFIWEILERELDAQEIIQISPVEREASVYPMNWISIKNMCHEVKKRN